MKNTLKKLEKKYQLQNCFILLIRKMIAAIGHLDVITGFNNHGYIFNIIYIYSPHFEVEFCFCSKLKHIHHHNSFKSKFSCGILIGLKRAIMRIKDMEEFQKQIAKGFIIERVNLSQATVAEAIEFKKHLEDDIELGYKIIIIDLSNCTSLDPAFIGVMVVTLKKLLRLGGSIKVVKPGMFSKSLLNLTGTIEIFELYESLENAIASISIIAQRDKNFSTRSFDRLAVAN